jgi:UDP-glucuronate decarboxylase
LIGWSPRTSLDTGLKATISWFAEDQSADNKAARVVEALASAISAGRA